GAVEVWQRMRGQAVAEKPQDFLERLRSRKAQVGEGLAGRRFEGTPEMGGDVPEATATGPTGSSQPPRAKPAPNLAPQAEPEAQDFASRLLRAKRKAMDERDRDRPK